MDLAISNPFDPSLAERARSGDRRAFAALHQRYAPMVHAVLLARVPRQEADDLLQDVFLLALRKIGSLRDAGALGPWLCTLARNRASDWWRRGTRDAELPEHVEAPRQDRAAAQEALDAIRELPEAYRETLLMRLVEGMTGPEIAAATGLTPGSVRVNLHRGMRMLRQRLGLEEPR